MKSERQFYRIGEVAEMLGIGRSLAYRLVSEGRIPSIRIEGTRSRRVSAQGLEDWVAKQHEQSADERNLA